MIQIKMTLFKKIAISLFCCSFSFIACTNKNSSDDKIMVAASILPLMDFSRQVGGEYINVFSIVPPGSNPHTFELTPELLLKCSRARLLVLNGIGLEYWAEKLIANMNKSDLLVTNTSEGIAVLQDDDHAEGNPHIWLDPMLAIYQINKIKDALCQVDPQHAGYYRQRTHDYILVLEQLDKTIREKIQLWRDKELICFHPSWNYFVNRYGLVQAAVIEKRPGFEPNPKEIAEIIEIAKKIKARAIFAEQQFPVKISEAIAAECGAQVILLNPLGGDASRFDYIKLMLDNVQQMALALE